MNQEELRTLVQINIDDRWGSRFPNEHYRLILNEAIKQVWRDFVAEGLFIDVQSADVTFIDQLVVLDDDFKNIQDVFYKDTNTSIDIFSEEKAKRSVEPCVFIRRTNTVFYLGWYEIPTSDIEVTYTYIEAPKELTEDEQDYVTCIPIEYHDLIALKASALAFSSDVDKFSVWDNRYVVELEKILRMLRPSSDNVVDVLG